jgi:hypothetical protein
MNRDEWDAINDVTYKIGWEMNGFGVVYVKIFG